MSGKPASPGVTEDEIKAMINIGEEEGTIEEEEKTMLEKMLYELQMSFVSVSKQVAEMMKQQKAQAAAGGDGEKTAEKPADEKPKIEKG